MASVLDTTVKSGNDFKKGSLGGAGLQKCAASELAGSLAPLGLQPSPVMAAKTMIALKSSNHAISISSLTESQLTLEKTTKKNLTRT